MMITVRRSFKDLATVKLSNFSHLGGCSAHGWLLCAGESGDRCFFFVSKVVSWGRKLSSSHDSNCGQFQEFGDFRWFQMISESIGQPHVLIFFTNQPHLVSRRSWMPDVAMLYGSRGVPTAVWLAAGLWLGGPRFMEKFFKSHLMGNMNSNYMKLLIYGIECEYGIVRIIYTYMSEI